MTPFHSLMRPLPDFAAEPAQVVAWIAERRGALFLDSAAACGRGRISVVACEPEGELTGSLSDPGQLREWLAANQVANAPGMNYPAGGAFGHVTYEGDFRFGLHRNLLIYRHDSRDWMEVGQAQHWLDGFKEDREDLGRGALAFRAETGRDWFEASVRRAQEYIAAGDIYQVNLAQRFVAEWPRKARPWDFYRVLRRVSPAPYAALLNWDGGALLSSSPELFLRFSGPSVETHPIKGTRPRFADPREDVRAAEELIHSEKERAELLMITDLERNDLGQFCEFGSVEVRELAKLERFEQVHHLVSVVRGRMRREFDPLEAFRLAFPGGSITGAPKKRAMEIIRELEGIPRGAYTGAIGYFGLNGESQFNIAIRTLELSGSRLEFRCGAGIVADSVPAAEYEETLHKAAGIFRAAEIWERTEERFALPGDSPRIAGSDGVRATVLRCV